jgi:hypothetical protein
VDEHKTSLDDRLARYVTGIPYGDQITIAQLLGMTSGVYDFVNDPEFVAAYVANPRERGSTTCHFYVSTLIAASLNPKVIQARLGHATITETMDTYGHLFPDAEDLGRGAIDAIFAVALTEQGRNQETR